jgi:hypothetical protein
MKRWLAALAAWLAPTTFAEAATRGAIFLLLFGGASLAIVIGTTTITGVCTNGYLLYNNAGVVGCTAPSSGTVAKYTATVGNGSDTTLTVTHSLNVTGVVVQVFNVSTGALVNCDITIIDANSLSLTFLAAPSSNQYRVVVEG